MLFLCFGLKIKRSNVRQYQYFLLLLCSVKERNKRIFRGRNFRDELILIDGTLGGNLSLDKPRTVPPFLYSFVITNPDN